MPRLLLRHGGACRQLASANATHDGSIRLSLVRSGVSDKGFNWSSGPDGHSPIEPCDRSEPKTKSITIHTSGRINYHFNGGGRLYAPCLLDIENAIPVVAYSIPGARELDAVTDQREDDYVLDIPEELVERITFVFEMVPTVLEWRPDEVGRLAVEGLYALSWRLARGAAGLSPDGVPDQAFTTARPVTGLPEQAVQEEVVYLRFRRAM